MQGFLVMDLEIKLSMLYKNHLPSDSENLPRAYFRSEDTFLASVLERGLVSE